MPLTKLRKTPGVYVEEISLFPPSVAPVETAIPAFIGYTEKSENRKGDNLENVPTRITSMLEFEQYFGKAQLAEFAFDVEKNTTTNAINITATTLPTLTYRLYYAMQMFFGNGGGPCYIVSVGGYNGGVARDALSGGVSAVERIDEVTMFVIPDAVSLGAADYATVLNSALQQCNRLQDRVAIMDIREAVGPDHVTGEIDAFRNSISSNLEEVKYGAAYYPYLETILNYYTNEENISIGNYSEVGEPSDDDDDGDDGDDGGGGAAGGTGTLDSIKNTHNEVYNAILQKISQDYRVILPPSSTIAGVYASVDRNRGVWKAPANVSLNMVVKPAVKVTDLQQEDMNVHTDGGKSINAIRAFTGRGTLVWGARTLAGNDNEWRYISVRRFFNFVEESVKKATSTFVFEPNSANTWVKVKSMIENFLIVQWRAGALVGAKPEHAFYVKVGLNETMSAEDILNGYMVVEIGMAVVRPAEFIILQFSHKMQES